MKRLSSDTKHKLQGYVFITPFILGCILFFFSPLIRSLQLSFNDTTKMVGLEDLKFVGLSHYKDAFVVDMEFVPVFLTVIRQTLARTPLIIVFSLIIAIMVNKKIRGQGLFRVLFFLPFLLGSGYVIEQLLGVGLDQMAVSKAKDVILPEQITSIIGETVTGAMGSFLDGITMVLWKSGVQIVIFLTGLQGISPSLYEAARCDSATEWDIFWKVTLPMMTPIILLNMVYTIVDTFNDSTNPMIKYFMKTMFERQRITYAAALSWIYFVFIALLLGIVFLFMGRIVNRTVGTK